MLSSTQNLPDTYIQAGEINFAKNKSLAILFNIVGLFVSILALTFLLVFGNWRHLKSVPDGFIIKIDLTMISQLLTLIAFVSLSLVLHELIHGFFFWYYTCSQPVYALHLAYAYTAAPGWYIPIRQYWIISLSPLVLMDLIGLLLIILAPVGWLLMLALLVAFNTGGSVGDLWISFCLIRRSPACLVNDVGDGVRFFEPDESKII